MITEKQVQKLEVRDREIVVAIQQAHALQQRLTAKSAELNLYGEKQKRDEAARELILGEKDAQIDALKVFFWFSLIF